MSVCGAMSRCSAVARIFFSESSFICLFVRSDCVKDPYMTASYCLPSSVDPLVFIDSQN